MWVLLFVVSCCARRVGFGEDCNARSVCEVGSVFVFLISLVLVGSSWNSGCACSLTGSSCVHSYGLVDLCFFFLFLVVDHIGIV
ncbi:hypothetical protein KC19_6G133900 [Ceratodon purpureus]|uniref:Uncharacterized protein n=1 Tax=Ceratodon purpureus TaxID=3225 RepID=A0A8T0HE38_CERPU|nr:hypothetical protein KC19_6G133900 [Ceratodon purpureus]